MKLKNILIISLIFLLAMGIASAADFNGTVDDSSADITEEPLAAACDTEDIILQDTTPEELSANHTVEGKTFDDIQISIDNSSDGDTILLNGDYKSGGKEITVNKSVTIQGENSACLDVNYTNQRVFLIQSNDVILKNLHLKNRNNKDYTDSGSAIYAKDYRITCINCTFENFHTTKKGTIYATECVFENCTFINCKSDYGGAIYVEKPTAPITDSSISSGGIVYHISLISNCRFVKCSGGRGGAVYSKGYIINSTFINCSVTKFGGAVYNGNVYNSTFIKCTAANGGATYNATSYNCTFSNCKAEYGGAIQTGNTTNSTFINCSATASGGAICNGNSYNCTFSNCKAEYGGAILKGNAFDSKFITCSATTKGGAIYNTTSYNCTFSNCKSTYGGAIYIGNLYDSTFINCSAAASGGAAYTGNIYNSYILNCTAIYGGALYNASATLTTFESCSATQGSAIRNGNAYNCTFKYFLDLENSTIVQGDNINPTYIDYEKKIVELEIVIPKKIGDFYSRYEYVSDYIYVYTNINVTGNATLYIDGVKKFTKKIETPYFDDMYWGYIDNAFCPITDIFPLSYGEHVLEIKYEGNRLYSSASQTKSFNHTYLYSNVPDIIYEDKASIDVYLPEKIGNINLYIDGKFISSTKYRSEEEDGLIEWRCHIPIPKLSYGNHTYTISHTNGNARYPGISESGSFVYAYPFYTEYGTYDAVYGNNVSVEVTVPEDASKDFEAYLNGERITGITKNGNTNKYTINVDNLKLGQNTLTVNYPGDNKYPSSSRTVTINTQFKIIVQDTVSYDEMGVVSLRLPVNATGRLVVEINGTEYNSSEFINGQASVTLPILNFTTINLTAEYVGSDYEVNNVSKEISGTPKINMPETMLAKSKEYITFELPSDADGNLSIGIAFEDIQYTFKDGKAKVDLSQLHVGGHTVQITYSGDSKYPDYEYCHDINVVKNPDVEDAKIYVPSEMTARSKEYITFELPSDANGNLSIKIDQDDASFTFKDGKAKVDLSNLPTGPYGIYITYTGDSKYLDYDEYFDLEIYYADPKIKITHPNKVVINTKTTIQITCAEGVREIDLFDNYFIYTSITPKNGKATFTFTPRVLGEYTLCWEYFGDDYYDMSDGEISFKVVPDGSMTASPLTKAYTSSKVFKVRVYDINGKAVKGKYVTFKVNGKKVAQVKTDSKGYASYKPTQAPGTYKISAEWSAVKVTKTLKIKKILSLKKVSVKKSAKKLELTAKLKKVDGKYLKGKKIKFKFNGKTYTAKTNKKGIAKVTIKKSVLKKLKVGKKVKYSATYLKDSVKRSVKIKK